MSLFGFFVVVYLKSLNGRGVNVQATMRLSPRLENFTSIASGDLRSPWVLSQSTAVEFVTQTGTQPLQFDAAHASAYSRLVTLHTNRKPTSPVLVLPNTLQEFSCVYRASLQGYTVVMADQTQPSALRIFRMNAAGTGDLLRVGSDAFCMEMSFAAPHLQWFELQVSPHFGASFKASV